MGGQSGRCRCRHVLHTSRQCGAWSASSKRQVWDRCVNSAVAAIRSRAREAARRVSFTGRILMGLGMASAQGTRICRRRRLGLQMGRVLLVAEVDATPLSVQSGHRS